MTPNPIHRALSLIRKSGVRALLMGGQACVFYGAAEFSRDIDLLLLLEETNLKPFQALLTELQARRIAVPPFEADYLRRGHAVHFRCHHPEAPNIRVDVMSLLRGVDPFPVLWERRTTVVGPDDETYELLSLPDLVLAKKTQRDKDWPMIRRLVEADYFGGNPTDPRVRFWLRELRTPEILIHLAEAYPNFLEELLSERPVLAAAAVGDPAALDALLDQEEHAERELDRTYWAPLRRELEQLRRAQRVDSGVT